MENFPDFDAVCVEGPIGGPVYEALKKSAVEFYVENGCKDEFVYTYCQGINYKFKIEQVSSRRVPAVKGRQDIIREIIFHTKEANRLRRMGKFSSAETMKHVIEGRVIGLRWVIGEVNTPIKELKKELKT